MVVNFAAVLTAATTHAHRKSVPGVRMIDVFSCVHLYTFELAK